MSVLSGNRFLSVSGRDCRLGLDGAAVDGFIRLPVIMLVADRAITPNGGFGIPEIVSEHVLAQSVSSWDHKPVTLGHPESGLVGAENSLDESGTVDSNAGVPNPVIGHLEGPVVANGKLRATAALRPDLIRLAGRDDLLSELTMRMLEVSVGVMVRAQFADGTDDAGVDYGIRWTEIVEADHLAILDDVPGACSNDMGCGLPRAAQRAAQLGENMNQSVMEKFLGVVERLMGIGMNEELKNVVNPSPEGDGEDRSLAAECGCGDNDDGSCMCGGRITNADSDNTNNQPQEEDSTVNVVDKLIALEDSPYTEEDREVLASFSETRIAELMEHYASDGGEGVDEGQSAENTVAESTSKSIADIVTPVAAQKSDVPEGGIVISAEQAVYFKTLVEREQHRQAEEKKNLIDRLIACKAYDQEQSTVLGSKSIVDLKELVRLAELNAPSTNTAVSAVTDFSALNRGFAPATNSIEMAPSVPADMRALFAGKEN